MNMGRNLGLVYKASLFAAVILSLIGLVMYSDTVIETAKKAISLCLEVIAPSLFPFFVVSNILITSGLAQSAAPFFEPIMKKLFGVGGACAGAFILGIVGGYPIGAKTAAELYKNRLCTKIEAERMLSFCNNSGPAFILGIVGSAVFDSSKAGLMLYAAHFLASVTTGICFKFYKKGKEEGVEKRRAVAEQKSSGFSGSFVASVTGAMGSILNISAFVIFFAVGVNLLFTTGIFTSVAENVGRILEPVGLGEREISSLLTGLLEMTSGLWSLAKISDGFTARLSMAAFMLGWAGVSVHCQTLSFLEHSGLSCKPYFIGKLMCAALSTVYIYVMIRLIPFESTAAVLVSERLSILSGLSSFDSLISGATNALIAAFVITVPILGNIKNKRNYN